MTATREDLHHLVDALDEDKVPKAAVALRGLAEQEAQPRRRLSFVAAVHGGPSDLADRHEEYLRAYFDRSA